MKKKLLSGLVVIFSLFLFSSFALAADLYVDDNDITCSGHPSCYAHVQDAVNAANPNDVIHVYPGTYGSRCFTTPIPPHYGPSDQCAPALIVWKNNIVIKAVDPNPANTIIQSTHNVWSNMAGGCGGGGAIEHSTGCTWVGSPTCSWTGTCVRPTYGTSPNGIAIIANGVTIDGFTIISTYGGDSKCPGQYPNTGGVLIGGLYSGDSARSGIDGATIKNSIIRGYSGVRLWKATHVTLDNNVIDNNIPPVTPAPPFDPLCSQTGATPEQAAVDVWDGWDQGTGSSLGLRIINNKITSYKNTWAVALGGFLSNGQIDHSNLFIDGNTITSNDGGVHLWNSKGTNKIMTFNNVVNVATGSKKILVEDSTYDGPFGIDKDGDGYDMCVDCNDNNPKIGLCTVPSMSPVLMVLLVSTLAIIGAKRIKV